jgi:conjugal transfer pilus assembly protein TrbC
MKISHTLLAAMVLCTWHGGFSQTQTPGKSALELGRNRIEVQRKQLFDQANPATQGTPAAFPSPEAVGRELPRIETERKELFNPENSATKGAKNNFPNVQAPAVSGVDIEALAKRYEQRSEALKTDDLMIFVSFSMPADSLKRILGQANKVGAAVVLNGFRGNSFKDTASAVKGLGVPSGNVIVNPNAFTKYRIRAVPAVVLTKGSSIDQTDADGCALPDTFVSVAGDVSLDYALENISQRDARFSELANRYNRQLKGRL